MTIQEMNARLDELRPLRAAAIEKRDRELSSMDQIFPHVAANRLGMFNKEYARLNVPIAVFLGMPSFLIPKKQTLEAADFLGRKHQYLYNPSFYNTPAKRKEADRRYTEWKAKYDAHMGRYNAAAKDVEDLSDEIDIMEQEIVREGLTQQEVRNTLAQGGHTEESVMEREKQKGTTDRARNEDLKEGELAVLHAEAKKLEMEVQAKTKKQKALATLGIAGGVIILLVVLGFIIKKFKKRKAT